MSDNDFPTSLEEVLDELKYGELPPVEEPEEANQAAPAAEDEDEESTSAPDKASQEPKEGYKTEPATDPEPGPEPGEGEEGTRVEDKADKPESDGVDATLIDLDGEKVTLEQIRAWRNDGLRQADYTRKTQEAAEQRRRLEERDALVAEIVADEAMSEFVSAHPKVLKSLLADPESTRAILGKPEEVTALWEDYELIADNPRLADRFGNQPDQASEVLAQQRYEENVMAIANALDTTVDYIAAQYSGVDADAVKDYVLSLGGMPEGDNVDPAEVGRAFERMFALFFVQDGEGGLAVDDRLIQSRFKELQSAAELREQREANAAEDHNKAVDAALSDKTPPATRGGKAPAPAAVDPLDDDAEDLNEVIHGLLGYE